ncbi:MAG: hypothetical protein K6F20_00195 [Bacteroidaceae bacterium]|nr:hypothetical protein [Bacteroidaceae bacterium]
MERYGTIRRDNTAKNRIFAVIAVIAVIAFGYVAKLYKNIITYGYIFLYYISGKWKVGDLQSAITANFAKNNAP